MSPIRMSKLETAIRVVIEFNDAFNSHDVDGMMKLMQRRLHLREHESRAGWHGVQRQGSHHAILAGLLPRVATGSHRDRGDF